MISYSFSESKKHKALVSKISIEGVETHIVKPLTFMNLSGQAVLGYSKYYKITPDNIIVIHDEADLPFGDIRLKLGGGTAGHNGLKSIIDSLGTEDFERLRFGIGRPSNPNIGLDDFVLSKWTEQESSLLETLIQNATNILLEAIISRKQ
jgi:PTH1 family peptidyl-tRNA hydrolase